MRHKVPGLLVICLLDVCLLVELVGGLHSLASVAVWSTLHIVLCLMGTRLLLQILLQSGERTVSVRQATLIKTATSAGSGTDKSGNNVSLPLLIVLVSLVIPGAGLVGVSLTLLYATRTSKVCADTTASDCQITPMARLSDSAWLDRKVQPDEIRGFTVHLSCSERDEAIAHRMLASVEATTSLAVDTLKQAMHHRDEKVRLAAREAFDRKVTSLSSEIQRREAELNTSEDQNDSRRWLQMASHYWEMAMLEESPAGSRKPLLTKAAAAATQAVAMSPENGSAHLVLGHLSLAQGDTRRASMALEQAQALGMSQDRVLPYLAECAFVDKNLPRVQQLLTGLDPMRAACPPLLQVARYWA